MQRQRGFSHPTPAYALCCALLFPFVRTPADAAAAPAVSMSVSAAKADSAVHTPAEIIAIMKKSPETYVVSEVKDLRPFNLVLEDVDSWTINPYFRIKHGPDSSFSIIEDVPRGRVAKLFEQAAEKLEKDDFASVKKLYEKALADDSTYFKTWTNLGDMYLMLGDYEKAERYMTRAVSMNEIGYQEYLFLADIYDKMRKPDKALDAITHAYMLNKNDLLLQKELGRVLAGNGLRLRDDRLEFPFQIKKTGVSRCEIQLRTGDGRDWLPMANCMACWEMEPEFSARLEDEKNRWNARAAMFRECLLNQGAMLGIKKNNGTPLSAKEQLLYDVLASDHINAIVYWEILAGDVPQVVLLLPAKEREGIVEYIKKYVYEKAD